MSDNKELAVIEAPRIAMPAAAAANYALDEGQWRALVGAVFPLAKTPEGVLMALEYCKQRKLDIFRKPVHLVPMKITVKDGDRKVEKEVETVWPGIGELRITAQRQPDFFGWDECEFGPMVSFKGASKIKKWVDGKQQGWSQVEWDGMVPEWAQFTVYKRLHNERIALKGPKVYFVEAYAPIGRHNACPNERWMRAPIQMLEKNAEAAALRRAWPDVFAGEYVFEEIEGKSVYDAGMASHENEVVEPQEVMHPVTAKPKRSDFKEEGEEAHFEEISKSGDATPPAEEAKPEPRERSLPQTQAQWESWKDNILDRVENETNRDKLNHVYGNQQSRIDAAPEEIRVAVDNAFTAKLFALGEANAGTGAGEGSNQAPEENDT